MQRYSNNNRNRPSNQGLAVASLTDLDKVAMECFKKKLSSEAISEALKDPKRSYTVKVGDTKFAIGNNGVANVLNRVRGLAMDRKTGIVADWFGVEPEPEDGLEF